MVSHKLPRHDYFIIFFFSCKFIYCGKKKNLKLETLKLVSSLTSQDIFNYNFQLVEHCSSKSALLLWLILFLVITETPTNYSDASIPKGCQSSLILFFSHKKKDRGIMSDRIKPKLKSCKSWLILFLVITRSSRNYVCRITPKSCRFRSSISFKLRFTFSSSLHYRRLVRERKLAL